MYHYVYYSYEEWGRGYIGVRSCECLPEEDCSYFGSYKDKTFAPTEKIILLTFSSREEANKAEITLHSFYDVARNPHFSNKANAYAEGFAVPGPLCEEHKRKIQDAKLEYWANEVTRQKHLEATREWWDNNPELFNKRKEALTAGRKKWASENRELVLEHQKKATEAAKLKALREPEKTQQRAIQAAKVRNQKLKEDPNFDLKRLEKVSKPVVLTTPEGKEIEFPSKYDCAKYLGISKTPIENKLMGRDPYKLRGYSLRLKDQQDR
jgi:hypothetical protein